MDKRQISIIVPAFNEEGNVEKLVKRIDHAMRGSDFDYEVIVIDDHSTDGTLKVVNSLSDKYPIVSHLKKGRKGKAYSLWEGFAYAKYDLLAIIDADLQYPPEAIPKMMQKINDSVGVVVANRSEKNTSFARRFVSRGFALIFGWLLHGLDCDVQSGLKVFKRQITREIKSNPSPWTFDLEFLISARNAGYKIDSFDINFDERTYGESKVNILKTSLEIGYNAMKIKLRKTKPIAIPPIDPEVSMVGAGTAHKGKRFITHTTLPREISAITTFTLVQKILIVGIIACLAVSFYFWPVIAGIVFIAILSAIYLADALFNFYLVARSLANPPELKFSDNEIAGINEKDLPVYTIMCPLFREADVLPLFLESIAKMDYPKSKLDLLLLLEEGDEATISTARSLDLPDYARIIIVPASMPKTKPKACNYGLAFARGEYLVIYDAEDLPEPKQLKKTYLAFNRLPSTVKCLQCKLNYFNTNQNLLTRLFTAEYSLWFDVVLPGLQSINTSIPLGGTSNHFRTQDLKELGGWDPFNVTEDADLGIRLFKQGFRTAIVESVTLEEANSDVGNWIRQRSRWIKGYMQTYLVHMRKPFEFWRTSGRHMLAFQLNVGGKIAFMIINPILWAVTLSYFIFTPIVAPVLEIIYPAPVLYMAVTSLVFGNFLYFYYYMIGCAKRDRWSVIKYIFFVPFYWLLMSIAALMASYQLLVKPYFWEKTKHGLHLVKPEKNRMVVKEKYATELNFAQRPASLTRPLLQNSLSKLSGEAVGIFKFWNLAKQTYKNLTPGMGTLLGMMMVVNVLNLFFNIFLGKVLNFEQLGLVIIINTIWSIAAVVVGAFGSTVNRGSAYLATANGESSSASFYRFVLRRGLIVALIVAIAWIISAPYLASFFNIDEITAILSLAPVFTFGVIASASNGFLKGNLFFKFLAYTMLFESLAKFAAAGILVWAGLPELVYLSVPISVLVAAIATLSMALPRSANPVAEISTFRHAFPAKFFGATLLAGVSATLFLNLDIIMVKHFLNPTEAGQYSLLSLAGKMVYFLTSLPNVFTLTFISRDVGLKRKTAGTFLKIMAASAILASAGFVFVGMFGGITIPFIFGDKAKAIVPYLATYSLAMAFFAIANVTVSYHLAKNHYGFSAVSIIFASLMAGGIALFHGSLAEITAMVFAASAFGLAAITGLHLFGDNLRFVKRGITDLRDAFDRTSMPLPVVGEGKKRILIFNWRDMKHKFAGGAELYIYEIAKRWAKQGHRITIFCGNDGANFRHEATEGIEIIRRGGFYLVYFWAFLYYFTQFKGKYDVIVDCHNGIPFFSPFYAKEPVFCLIHHIHQEVFRRSLIWPMATLAIFLEKVMMPLVYRNVPIITVSNSSKAEIESIGLGENSIDVVHPGVDLASLKAGIKSPEPIVLYLGRLKAYKSIDVLLRAFASVVNKIGSARLVIAGSGEEEKSLKKLTEELGLNSCVQFLGVVPDKNKVSLLQKAWVFVNPSFMEGWGITTIEANACGTPVIASDVPGLCDSVVNPHTGYLVEYGDVDGFAKKIIEMLEGDKLRARMERNAIEWAKNFNWDIASEKFMRIINNNRPISNMVNVLDLSQN